MEEQDKIIKHIKHMKTYTTNNPTHWLVQQFNLGSGPIWQLYTTLILIKSLYLVVSFGKMQQCERKY